jgi:hypothetical protein
MDEIRLSMMAQLAAAMTLEGVANEVGQERMPGGEWAHIDKASVVGKWLILSRLYAKEAFEPGKEPLQTVTKLYGVRNRLAHAKPIEQGTEITVVQKDGTTHYGASLDIPAAEVDAVFVGIGPALKLCSGSIAKGCVRKTCAAVRTLKTQTGFPGFAWLESVTTEYGWLST